MLTTMTLAGAHQNIDACRRFPVKCYMTLGIHPYHATDLYDGTTSLQELADTGKQLVAQEDSPLVAFGEIGLDYFHLDRADKNMQQKAFIDQLELATAFDLPLFLHARDACEDFISIIKPFIPRLRKGGIVHSFAGSKAEMLSLVDLGFDISVNGVSFKTDEQLEMVKAIPLERLQLETDAPWCEITSQGSILDYLKEAAPLPVSRKHGKFVKGDMVKGRNESCTIDRVARIVAGIKGIPLEQVTDAAWRNSIRMFDLGVKAD